MICTIKDETNCMHANVEFESYSLLCKEFIGLIKCYRLLLPLDAMMFCCSCEWSLVLYVKGLPMKKCSSSIALQACIAIIIAMREK